MPASTVVEIALDPELHAALMDAARNEQRPVADIVHELVRQYVAQEPTDSDYDAFLQRKVEAARASILVGNCHPNDAVEAEFAAIRSGS